MYTSINEKKSTTRQKLNHVAVQRRSQHMQSGLVDNRLITKTDSVAQLDAQAPIQRVRAELMDQADTLLAALNSNTVIDINLLRTTMTELQEEYLENYDQQDLDKWQTLKDALTANAIPVLSALIQPLLVHVKSKIREILKENTPPWVENLPDITFTLGDGIAGGLAVGQDEIFVTPGTGAELILEGTAEFAIAHEIAHLISGSIGISKSKGLLRSNGALENSGVAIESTDDNRAAKLEEVRADIFGVDMLSSYMGVEPSTLDANKIKGAISAPSDNEHPSTKERESMLTTFRGIKF